MRRFPTMQEFKATVPPGGLLNPSLRQGGGIGMNVGRIRSTCPTPGLRIHSKRRRHGLSRPFRYDRVRGI